MTPVSVLIPAYNAAATLARALASVRAQAVGALEIVVVDDGSRDETVAIARAHGVEPLVLPRNGGESVAMNAGVEAARHPLIAFLDADDEWMPGKLARQLPLHDAGIVFSCTGHIEVDDGGRVIDSAGLTPFPHAGREFWRNLLERSVVAKPSVIARRDALLAAGLFDPRQAVAADQDMWLRLAMTGPVAHCPEPLLHVHAVEGSLMGRHARPDLAFTIPMIERALAALGDRLTPEEKRRVLGRRWSNAARNLAGAGDWPMALGAALTARRLGVARGGDWSAIAAALPLVRKLRARLPASRRAR